MNGQQNVLYGVFYIARIAMAARGKQAQIGRYIIEKVSIRFAVATLGAGHED
jgi:hypothetical protein